MQIPKTFHQCLSDLMHIHRMSQSSLGSVLGTKADLKHVLFNDGNEARRLSLYRLIEEKQLFSIEELDELKASLEVSKIGKREFLARQSIGRFLQKDAPDFQPIMLPDGKPLMDRLKNVLTAEKIRILCINSCFVSLYASLASLFTNPDRDIEMRHYVQVALPACDTASFVYCVSPLLFDSRYMPHTIGSASSELCAQHVSGNLMIIQCEKGGRKSDFLFVIKDRENAYELPRASHAGLYDFFSMLINDIEPVAVLLKDTFAQKHNYESIMMLALSRELNRATYLYEPSLCFLQAPSEIMLHALHESGVFTPNEQDEMIKRILPIYEQRHHNFYHKKKPNYCIMAPENCREFLVTGLFHDHFFGFRRLIPAERVEIFELMLKMARENNMYHPLLTKKPFFDGSFQVICYERIGLVLTQVLMILNNGFDSISLIFPEFTQQYINYYMDHMVQEQCHTQEESLRLLEEMLTEYRRTLTETDQSQSGC